MLSEKEESQLLNRYCGAAYFGRASSTEINDIIQTETAKGRLKWAQLSIELDGIVLAFWLPAELKSYCKIFDTTPFPTARTLLKASPNATELNRHWLSRLPKQAKSKKFRERFLKYVASCPPALKEFYDFYDEDSERDSS